MSLVEDTWKVGECTECGAPDYVIRARDTRVKGKRGTYCLDCYSLCTSIHQIMRSDNDVSHHGS